MVDSLANRESQLVGRYCSLVRILLFMGTLLLSSSALAQGVVPRLLIVDEGDPGMTVSIPSGSVKRARVLYGTSEGIRSVPMTREESLLTGGLGFSELSVLRYQVQFEREDGSVGVTPFYEVAQPSGDDREREIADLKVVLTETKAKVLQRQNTLLGIRNTDPKALTGGRNEELARAYLALTKAERAYQKTYQSRLDKWNGAHRQELSSPKGVATQKARSEHEAYSQSIWRSKGVRK